MSRTLDTKNQQTIKEPMLLLPVKVKQSVHVSPSLLSFSFRVAGVLSPVFRYKTGCKPFIPHSQNRKTTNEIVQATTYWHARSLSITPKRVHVFFCVVVVVVCEFTLRAPLAKHTGTQRKRERHTGTHVSCECAAEWTASRSGVGIWEWCCTFSMNVFPVE